MKARIILLIALFVSLEFANAQTNKKHFQIDSLIFQGDYSTAIDSSKSYLKKDSLNAELYYKLGIAYQNMMVSDKSSAAFIQAVKLAPENKKYSFALGKYYFTSGKAKKAEPIFKTLYESDTLNWIYGYYLTDIYMQQNAYKKALVIYDRFYKKDTTSFTFLDKIGFCNLRMGELDTARVIFEKSLSMNSKNIPSLKNLSYIYYRKGMIDTAIYQLNLGIGLDTTDMDLLSRRGDIYYNQNHHYRARPDYLKVLASGDSSKIVLKRIGIGLAANNQPVDAIGYLMEAFQKDSNDFEISSYIGQTYFKLKQYEKSIKYYNKVIKLISPITRQIDYTYVLLADSYKESGNYEEAINFYCKSLDIRYTSRMCMTVANLYDEKLKNYDKAIQYYNLFLNNIEKSEIIFLPEYIENVKNRLNWLVDNKNKKK
ncbi:MAG: tetratricopeptide repeat protein [Tenuifilaceae bacterium]